MSPYDDVPTDGSTQPLLWQERISGDRGIVTPIGVYMVPCSGNPCYMHTKFLYLTVPSFLQVIFGQVAVSTATRYHTCLN